jgi:histidine ammonia-lyase
MGMTAARHARDCVAIAEQVLALELLAAAQALDLRAPVRPGVGSAAALEAVRGRVAFLDVDRELASDIDAALELVSSGDLVARVCGATVPLN